VGKAIAMSMDDEFLESRERRHAKETGLQRPVMDLVHGVLGAVSFSRRPPSRLLRTDWIDPKKKIDSWIKSSLYTG
jgi:hypothetical protein